MFLLFGEQAITKIRAQGEFECPSCAARRRYQQIHRRNFFSVFWIPLLPLEVLSDYVECDTCHDSFHATVLQDASVQATYRYGLRRVLAALLYGSPDPQNLREMQALYQEICHSPLDEHEAQQALAATVTEAGELQGYLHRLLPYLNEPGSATLLEGAARFAARCYALPLPHPARVILNRLAGLLGYAPAAADALIRQALYAERR